MLAAIILTAAIFTLLYGGTSIIAQVVSYLKIPGYSKQLDATLWLVSSILFGIFYYIVR